MPYLANIEGVIWLVVIAVSIIAQIIKGAKKVQANAPKSQQSPRSQPEERRDASAYNKQQRPKPATSYRERTDEIRQFFERLGEPLQEVVAPAPRQPKRTTLRSRKAQPQPAPTIAPVAPAPVQATKPTVSMAASTTDRTSSQARALRKLLKSSEGQKQAILLREVLGPPLALR